MQVVTVHQPTAHHFAEKASWVSFEPIGPSGVTGGASSDGQEAGTADVGKYNRHTGCHQCADKLQNGISVTRVSTMLVVVDDCYPEQRGVNTRVNGRDVGTVVRVDQCIDIYYYLDADRLIP